MLYTHPIKLSVSQLHFHSTLEQNSPVMIFVEVPQRVYELFLQKSLQWEDRLTWNCLFPAALEEDREMNQFLLAKKAHWSQRGLFLALQIQC